MKKYRQQMSEYWDDKISKISNLIISLTDLKAKKIEDIADTVRGLGGTCKHLYFETISYVIPD